MIIIMLNLFIMIQYHNKNYHQRWSDDKITLKQTENYESINLNHHWVDIELIPDKTYEHEKLIMINLSSTLVKR
jgi:hypothetical protein